jgi:malonate decarboxylase delta subunit
MKTEQLHFEFAGKRNLKTRKEWILVGVVGSGNLEVLMQKADLPGKLQVEVCSSITGFSKIWQAVLSDFAQKHDLQDVKITINDMGATPAVVSLRLDQALEEWCVE